MSRTVSGCSAVVSAAVAVMLATGTSVASAQGEVPVPVIPGPVPELAWEDCGTTPDGTSAGVQCAAAELPLDYDEPDGDQVQIAVARVPATDPAQRIGSLFFNFGGPGGAGVDYLQGAGAGRFAALNERFDIVGFDPRGVGQSTPAIDCKANQETEGIYSVPVPTPLDIDVDTYVAKVQAYVDSCLANNGPMLEHVSTANVARDMDSLRAALGEEQLTYLGYSYGTFLGATYASLFPANFRALVLDGPVDAEGFINDPMTKIAEQTAGFEIALARFLEACAVNQEVCAGFGGESPYTAYDQLIASAEEKPIPAEGYTPDPRPVGGDEIRAATLALLYAKQAWPFLAEALSGAAAGDGTLIRAVFDSFAGREDDGTFSPRTDRYLTITASEQKYPQGDVQPYLDRGSESWASFPHFWSNSGYAEIAYALWPKHDEDAYAGPFTVAESAPTALVVATTYDPATPYPGALRLVQDLGNARLLTMEGDGHTAYGGNAACIDSATEAYLIDGTLPEEGTVCAQEVPFEVPEPVLVGGGASSLPEVDEVLSALVGSRR